LHKKLSKIFIQEENSYYQALHLQVLKVLLNTF